MRVYGQVELISQVARSRAPVTILSGDSGIGKSTVLQEAQGRQEDGIAPAPRTVPQSGGVLQRALLDALGDAVAEIVAKHGAAEIMGRHLVDAAQRLAKDRGQELAKVVGSELLNLVKARLGSGVGDAIAGYVRELKTAADESLAQRISASVDPGVAGLVVDFSGELASLSRDRQVLLALDAGERLREDDLRVLAELAEHLPDEVRLRIAMSTYTALERDRVDRLRGLSSHVAILEIPGLDREAIADWLEAEALDRSLAGDVERVTGGYGLHVDDMIGHLKRGGQIQDAPLNRTFSERTRDAWNSLDRDAKTKARSLCVFGDPLPPDRLERFLNLDEAARAQLEDDFIRARIFSVQVNGSPWFHEQRRQVLVDEILHDDERAEACARAVEELLELGRAIDSFDRLPELARLVPHAERLLAADSQLDAAVNLDRNELALAAGLIELVEPTSPALLGDSLLDYSRKTFGGEDLVNAIERLGSRDLVAVVKEHDAAAVVPYWREVLVKVTIAGRAFNELGRMPIPAVASSVFELEVLPRIGVFEKGHYGIGQTSAAGLGELIPPLRQPDSGLIIIGGDVGANLLVRGRYAGRPLYGAFTFTTSDRRDEAARELDAVSSEVFGELFETTDVIPHPLDPVPSRRFLSAIERMTGMTFPVGEPKLDLDEAMDPAEALQRKAAALAIIRQRCSTKERFALELEEPVGYLWYAERGNQGELFYEAEVRGGWEGAEPFNDRPELNWNDPYRSFKLAQQAQLAPGERLGHQHVRMGKDPDRRDPIVSLVATLQKRARRFNKAQKRRHQVLIESESLTNALSSASRQMLSDARALADVSPIGYEGALPEPRRNYVIVYLDPPDPHLVTGGYSTVDYSSAPNPEGEEEVHVAVVPRKHSTQDSLPETEGLPGFADLFGLSAEDTQVGGRGLIDHVLGPMLGFFPEELGFRLEGETR